MFLGVQKPLEIDLGYRFGRLKHLANMGLGSVIKNGFDAGDGRAGPVGFVSEIANVPGYPRKCDPTRAAAGAVHHSTSDII